MEHTQENNLLQRPFLTAAEAAEYLGIALVTLYGYSSSRTIPHYKTRRKIYFKIEDLDAFVLKDENRVMSSEEITQEAASYEAKKRP
ncbi:MAG: helix-turn-helix domain-containing protein [Candidatus Cloacimonetes bacterium]|nr:helix-turn-helix domain-containing protein [Candidatus Cloacimonadota bacterium]